MFRAFFKRGKKKKGVEADGKILRSWKGEPFMIYDFIRFGANGNGQWSDGTLAPHAFFTPCSEIGVCVEQSAKDPIFTNWVLLQTTQYDAVGGL